MTHQTDEGDIHKVLVEMASLRAQIKGMSMNLSEIKSEIGAFSRFELALVEMTTSARTVTKEIETLWKRVDGMRSDIDTVAADLAALTNKGRGAIWVGGICIGAVQITLVAAVAWVFNNVSQDTLTNHLQQQRIDRIEQQVEYIQRKTGA